MTTGEASGSEAPVTVYRPALVMHSILMVMLLAFAGLFFWASRVESDPWWLVGAAWSLFLVFLIAGQLVGRLEVWPDRFVVRRVRRVREYRFADCSEFRALTFPTLHWGGRVVAFTHAPGGESRHRVFKDLVGHNVVLRRYRGGAQELARDLNQFRERDQGPA